MKYAFNEDYDLSVEDRILQINNIDKNELLIDTSKIDYNNVVLNNFKEMLLSNKDKRFFIVGDYDCDGICATAIMSKLFTELNIESNYYIPSRTKEGYGLNNRIVQTAHDNNFDCLLCVDNGIVANDSLQYAKQLGMKTFVIDHHEYQQEPNCDCYIHPNILPEYFEDMCAGGLCAMLANSFGENDFAITLGGLATLADMVSVFKYNRYLMNEMIHEVSKGKFRSINLLLGNCEVNYTNIQYNVIPKINAVSRLDDLMNVNYVVKFLLGDETEALKYYDKIEVINRARKDYSKQMYELAKKLVDCNQNIIVIKHSEFKEGLCGLVANKLVNEFNKPVIILAEVDGILKGSGRSVVGSNLYAYLKNANELFDTFGGHEMAIGITLRIENYNKLMEYVSSHILDYDEQIKDVLMIDEKQINNELLETINSMQPFGTNFKEPLFGLRNVKYSKKYIVANKYPKFDINDSLSAISFNSKFIDKDFEYMIGHIQKDSYYSNRFSFVIEDLA